MSSTVSSSRGAALALTACAAALFVSGCGKTATGSGAAGSTTRAFAPVGYVRMDDLLKRHPLYPELTRLDDDVQALQFKKVVASNSQPSLPPDQFKKEQAAIAREFAAAADRAKAALKAKQDEYAKLEAEAIREALGSVGATAGAPGGAAIGSTVNGEFRAQAQSVASGAQKNLEAYRKELLAHDTAALRAIQNSLNASAARTYRTKAEQLQKAEADYALGQAQADAPERVALNAKLSNLVLDDAAREDARKQLSALDHKETDGLAALKNRDSATLAALQKQLRDGTDAELQRQADLMRSQTLAKINKRESDVRQQIESQLGALPVPGAGGGAAIPANVAPAMRARLDALHKKYQDEFTKDAKVTIGQFEKTRTELQKRMARLEGVDVGAEVSSNQQLDALQKQRRELYDQMIAQIEREVKIIAARRGLGVVLSDVMAPAGGVDLTADAEKDIESLHE
jgi:hypothetical protein